MEKTKISYPIDISVVIPLFNEEESLQELCTKIDESLSGLFSFEIIFVDDGSTDSSWQEVEKLKELNNFVHGISFKTNQGKSVALQAGFGKGCW